MKHVIYKIYALGGYAISMGALTYYFGWLSGLFVPVTVNGPALIDLSYGGGAAPVVANMILMALFMFTHSTMARPDFKKRWLKTIPQAMERATYIWMSGISLAIMMLLWQPLAGVVWVVPSAMAVYGLHALYALGILILVGATFCIDHFELFGLKQGFAKPGQKVSSPPFVVRGLYVLVRHPIMTGLLIMFWATPAMSTGHLLYAVVSTVYIVVVIFKLEEKDLIRFLGADYEAYKKKVPAFFPIKLK